MLGVTLNGNHTGTEWGLHWTSCDISEPVPITSYVDIPGRKTKLDATESLFGSVTFENRTITLGFWAKTTWAQWMALTSKIQTAIGGRWCKIVLDTEPDKYWMGRVTVSSSMSADNPVMSFSRSRLMWSRSSTGRNNHQARIGCGIHSASSTV